MSHSPKPSATLTFRKAAPFGTQHSASRWRFMVRALDRPQLRKARRKVSEKLRLYFLSLKKNLEQDAEDFYERAVRQEQALRHGQATPAIEQFRH